MRPRILPSQVTFFMGRRPRTRYLSSQLHRNVSSIASSSKNPIFIVGGGPSGLFMSILLSQYDVPNVLLEQHSCDSRFRHPQAHFLNTRTMELLKYHLPDETYKKVLHTMPPVDDWTHFRFAYSMSKTPLATVLHPVHQPLQAGIDSNGLLIDENRSSESIEEGKKPKFLSPCSVGHLAQHTFCKILYDLAVTQPQSTVCYGSTVIATAKDPASHQCTVNCHDGTIYTTPLVIAADGAQSSIRTAQQIPWRGQRNMQHLVNIHVTLDPHQAKQLHQHDNHAMLYSIFNEHVVAMVVCHSIGDYIVQIPYFPPYQTMEHDFAPNKIHILLKSIFGPFVQSWTVQSAKPWVMGSMIAERYFNDNMVLIGDAAHVFPPAGGFGMNTGLQDAHNLAWKVAMWYHGSDGCANVLKGVLQSYQRERQPVAQQNAALSVRNYQRLLKVTESCYLHEKHPSLLVKVLEKSPLPLIAKQSIFRSLFKTALLPLAWLGSAKDSLFSTHIRNNLRKALQQGTGLPLLFPKHEIGFDYGATAENETALHWKHDTAAMTPALGVGKLVPHAEAKVMSEASRYSNLRYLRPGIISTTNHSAQMSRTSHPCFVLLVVGIYYGDSAVERLQQLLVDSGLAVEVAWLNCDGMKSAGDLQMMEADLSNAAFSFRTQVPCVILIRPDSHICAICTTLNDDEMDRLKYEALASFQTVSSGR
ncbi:hypothetical protein MPSEU_000594000 [Mayamaea pseudoterrestris]|nr:hypothetical protein MPSEU_000594000 [Mayamaea pseudoterrestris]